MYFDSCDTTDKIHQPSLEPLSRAAIRAIESTRGVAAAEMRAGVVAKLEYCPGKASHSRRKYRLIVCLALVAHPAALGAIGARLGGASAGRGAFHVLIGGVVAMSVTALIGNAVGTVVFWKSLFSASVPRGEVYRPENLVRDVLFNQREDDVFLLADVVLQRLPQLTQHSRADITLRYFISKRPNERVDLHMFRQ